MKTSFSDSLWEVIDGPIRTFPNQKLSDGKRLNYFPSVSENQITARRDIKSRCPPQIIAERSQAR